MDSTTYAFDLAFDRSPVAADPFFDVAGTHAESALTPWPAAAFGIDNPVVTAWQSRYGVAVQHHRTAPNAPTATATKAPVGPVGIAMTRNDGRPPRGAPC